MTTSNDDDSRGSLVAIDVALMTIFRTAFVKFSKARSRSGDTLGTPSLMGTIRNGRSIFYRPTGHEIRQTRTPRVREYIVTPYIVKRYSFTTPYGTSNGKRNCATLCPADIVVVRRPTEDSRRNRVVINVRRENSHFFSRVFLKYIYIYEMVAILYVTRIRQHFLELRTKPHEVQLLFVQRTFVYIL